MKTIRLYLIGLFLIVFSSSVFAVKVSSLYSATIPVSTQSPEERSQVAPLAMIRVLTKVTGNNPLTSNPSLKSNLNNASTLIDEFSYTTNTDNNKPYLLSITFRQKDIDEWLRNANLPIWNQDRPLIIAWVAWDAPKQSTDIISDDSPNEWSTGLKQGAKEHGLRLLLPLMDAKDIQSTSIDDITSLSAAHLQAPSTRYATNALLVGHVTENSKGFVTEWKLALDGTEWNWHLTAKTINDVIPLLMDNIAHTLSSRFAVATSNAAPVDVTLKVTNIVNENDFRPLTSYLYTLPSVDDVAIVEINKTHEVTLKISIKSTPESFFQSLTFAKKLIMLPSSDPSMAIYQWHP